MKGKRKAEERCLPQRLPSGSPDRFCLKLVRKKNCMERGRVIKEREGNSVKWSFEEGN